MTSSTAKREAALYRRIAQTVCPYWPNLAAIFALSLLAVPLALLTPLPLKIVVDSVLGSRPLPRVLDEVLPSGFARSPGMMLTLALGVMLTVAVLTQLRDSSNSLLATYTGEKLVRGFRAQLFHHAQRLSLSYHDRKGTADSLYRIQYDAASIQYIAVEGIVPFISSALTFASMIYVTMRIDRRLALVALTISPALFVVSRIYRPRLRRRSRKARRRERAAMAVVHEVFAAARVVKAFGQEKREEKRFVEQSTEGMRQRLRKAVMEGSYGLLVAAITGLGTAGVLFIGVRSIQAGTLTLGSLLLVMGYITHLYTPLKTMSRKAASLQTYLVGAERAFALLDEAPDVAERPNPRPLGRAAGAMRFCNVSFAYEQEEPVLRDISFEIEPGMCLGITGTTGAGKTTLVNLLTRFYDPTAGAILLDGVDLRAYKLSDLRNQFAIVLQEPVLFSTTIAENIAYARPDASEAEIVVAAKAANVHEFISSLPKGYATPVGERGMRLSGGERQRISVARAFLKNAPILILDEPTSAVDLKTEAAIVEAMERLMRGRTTFLITHRPSTLKYCEAILRLEHGSVASFESLRPHRPAGTSKRSTEEISPEALRQHPAARAWCELQRARTEPGRIDELKHTRKSEVYRMHDIGPDGAAVIVKRCRAATFHVERMIYQEFLPLVPVPALRCYGFLNDSERDLCWLFLEDAVGETYSPQRGEHRALAGSWLAKIHLALPPSGLKARLPDRGLDYYRQVLRRCSATLVEHLADNTTLRADDIKLLPAIVTHWDLLESHWSDIERICEVMPATLVHDDFVGKNVRIKNGAHEAALLVFDWEYAGWGMPAIDLAQSVGNVVSPDLEAYCSVMERDYPHLDLAAIKRVAGCGSLLRLVEEMYWATLAMRLGGYELVAKPIASLRVYDTRLVAALRALNWCDLD